MQPPNTRITVFGGTYPAQIWARFMREALAGSPPLPLFDPAAIPAPTTTVAPSDPAALEVIEPERAAEVPDVVGLRPERARARLRSAGFEATVLDAPVGSGTPGTVAGQGPTPGTRLPLGTTVVLEVVPGDFVPTVPVPDLRGFGGNQARDELTRLGFSVTIEPEAPPAGAVRPDGRAYVPGQVWRTVPPAGTVSPDGRVTVVIMPASAASTTTPARPARPSAD
jgi:beta-lactam-binding protein with PASTA domain